MVTMTMTVFVVGMLVAVIAAWRANVLDRQEGKVGDAPVRLLVVLLLVAIGQAVYADQPYQNPCDIFEPYSLEWWAGMCFWYL